MIGPIAPSQYVNIKEIVVYTECSADVKPSSNINRFTEGLTSAEHALSMFLLRSLCILHNDSPATGIKLDCLQGVHYYY